MKKTKIKKAIKTKEKPRMTAAELSKNIGKEGQWTVNAGAGVTVAVKITDARESFGRLDYKITPVAGSGEVWVDSQNVTI